MGNLHCSKMQFRYADRGVGVERTQLSTFTTTVAYVNEILHNYANLLHILLFPDRILCV